MTKEEIYEALHKIDVIAELEKKPGVWYIENSIDERRSTPTSYWPTLEDAVGGLMESSDWFGPKGTGTIHHKEFGIDGNDVYIYSGGWDNEFGKLWI